MLPAATPLLLAVLLALPGDDLVEQDVVWLADGKQLQGQVVYEDDDLVVVRKGSRETEVPRSEVRQVDSRVRSLREVLERLAAFGPAGPPDKAALLEMARFAEHARLPGEARLLRLWTLLADPEDREANEALGHRERREGWSYKHRGRWHLVADMGLPPADWGERWTLDSVHFELRSNLPLQEAILLLLDAERFLAAFYDLFARTLRLPEPPEVMVLEAHADEASFPEPPDGGRGYFDPEDRIVDLLTPAGRDFRRDLFHELTHQVLYMTTERMPRARGEVPAWLVEGLAEAFATGLQGRLGTTSFDVTAIHKDHFRIHAASERPYTLDRVLAFRRDDFYGTTDRALKYAQCATLVNLLLAGEQGRWRDAFGDYLRQVWDGKASPTTFKKTLAIEDEEAFEGTWLAWAKTQAL